MCTVLLPPGGNPIAINKYIISIKSRRMRWAGHVALMARKEVYTGFWRGNLRERTHLGDPGIDRVILRLIFRK